MRKVITFNTTLIFLLICIKVGNYIYIKNLANQGFSAWIRYRNFFTLYVYKSEDAATRVIDFSIFILIIGLLVNLLFFCKSIKKQR